MPDTKVELDEVVWLAFMQLGQPLIKVPKVSEIVDKVIELMAERHGEWQQFPDWCRNRNNVTFNSVYNNIYYKLSKSVEFLNVEIQRRQATMKGQVANNVFAI
jgi:hypothetical protein